MAIAFVLLWSVFVVSVRAPFIFYSSLALLGWLSVQSGESGLRKQGKITVSVTVALKTMAGEVQHDEHQHQHTDHGEEYLDS